MSGHIGVRLRTHCRIRHNHKCDSIYNLRLRKFAPCKGAFRNCNAISSLRGSRQIRLQAAALGSMQSRNTQSIKRSFVRWVYFALKRRGLVREVRLLPFVPSHFFLLNHIYRSVPRSHPTHRRKNFTIGSSGAFPPFPDTPALPFLSLPRLVQSYILYINPALP